MPAVKRQTKPLAYTATPAAAAPVETITTAHAPRSSGARELRDLLEARLNAPVQTQVQQHWISPIGRVGIVTLLAALAWAPIAAVSYIWLS